MPESTMQMQEYLESYIPSVIERFLAEKPVPQMEGTSFTTQVTVEGERSFTFGIKINDAREIKVEPGGLENPMLSVSLTEDVFKPVTSQVTQMVGRKQFDEIAKAKGTLTIEAVMPGEWVLPIKLTFNGASDPKATMRGPAEVILKVMTGELNGPQAFMGGQMKIDGDMMFLMSLSSLVV
jgi:hypothetical protein